MRVEKISRSHPWTCQSLAVGKRTTVTHYCNFKLGKHVLLTHDNLGAPLPRVQVFAQVPRMHAANVLVRRLLTFFIVDIQVYARASSSAILRITEAC
jgi:hypothetical protein